MLSERLKKETHQSHVALEKLVIPAIKNLHSRQAYASLLQLFYGYFKPVEERVDAFINETIIPDYPQRRKATVIEEDMHYIGKNGSLKICEDVPEITSAEEALGALYVMEGSTLGGKILTKIISEKMNLSTEMGVKFFNGYGEHTMERWLIFKACVDNFSTNEQSHNNIVKAANETFIKFKNWIQLNQTA